MRISDWWLFSYLERLTSCIPGAEEVDTAREEPSLKETKNRSERRNLRELLDKSHTNHDSSPEHGDDGQMISGSYLANENCRRGLEDDVWDKEDQVGDVLSTIVSQVHRLSHYMERRLTYRNPVS